MAKPPPLGSSRSYVTLAAAIVIAAVIISATIFAASTSNSMVTKTSTQATTSTTTQTATFVVTSSGTLTVTAPNPGGVYQLTFRQVPYCGQFNIAPWAVTLDNIGLTQVQPTNQSLPLPTNTFSTAVPQGLTHMTFVVPSGTYNYTVSGGTPGGIGGELYPGNGTVKVNGSDVSVNIGVSLSFTCTSTAAP